MLDLGPQVLDAKILLLVDLRFEVQGLGLGVQGL